MAAKKTRKLYGLVIHSFLNEGAITAVNPRTYTQIHTLTVVQLRRAGELIEPLLRVFDMVQYFEMILPSVESKTMRLLRTKQIHDRKTLRWKGWNMRTKQIAF